MTRTFLVLALALAAMPAEAQLTTGSITGRITDEQGAAIPGATVEATNPDTGFTRLDVTNETGTYRLGALPVGAYRVAVTMPGFATHTQNDVVVNVATNLTFDLTLRLATVTETVTVTAAPAPISTSRSSALGEVVDLARIEALPLNGRQFANLSGLVPGVGLGFHSDVSKSTQYVPQISGGNGRNVVYIVDGGDNNDDINGGLLQLFPLEAVQEFNVLTHRFDAEYGRSSGAVLNVVTKSGTNDRRGSWFTLFRDDALNARTFSERRGGVEKQAYRRFQFGGSTGGPIVRDGVHYFAAYERTQQDTRQVVDTRGLFPADDGVFDVPFREDLFTVKLTAVPSPAHYVAVRYGRDGSSQPSGASPTTARSAWGTSTSGFHSMNVNHNWAVRSSALNEFVFQYSDFRNEVPASGDGPTLRFPNGVFAGSTVSPQRSEQTKWQFRNDFSWTSTRGGGLGHEIRAGGNWVHEPRLFTWTGQFRNGFYQMGANSLDGPIASVTVIGGNTEGNIPLDFYGVYLQDDWRVTERLTLNLGVRWDYVDGMPYTVDSSPNFQAMQAAGLAGRFAGTVLDDFGHAPRGDRDNVQPRIGAAFDVRGDGRDIVRGGWGIYTDLAYINANALTSAYDAGGGGGVVFSASTTSPAGLLKADGTPFRLGDPLSTIAALNGVNPNLPLVSGEVVSPLLEQPYTRQTNAGWSHQLDEATSVSVDYVRVEGRDLNLRLRPNTLVNGRRYLGDVGIQPNNNNFRVALSKGESLYNGLIFATRRRMSSGFDVNGSYTLSKATSDVGSAYDEIVLNLVQDVTDPFAPVQEAPSARTDARHRVTVSAVVHAPWDFRIAPILYYRSGLPLHTFEGRDLNADGNLNDRTALAYRYAGLNDDGSARFEEVGPCETVNCSRRAPFSQVNLRVSKSFRLPGTARIEAIGEVFNLFNAKNPTLTLTSQRLSANGTPNAQFMQAGAFAGDVQQTEQRVGQIGFRLTF